MEWEFLVALIVAIPIILFPAAFVWYLNAGGLFRALRERLARRAASDKTAVAAAKTSGPAFGSNTGQDPNPGIHKNTGSPFR